MLDKQERFSKIQSVVAEVLSIDKNDIKPDSTLESLGVDSLDTLEIVMKLEELFGVEIDDEQTAQIKTIQDAVDKINTLLEQ